MSDLQTLFQTVDALSADELKQLYLYIAETRLRFAAPSVDAPPTPRTLGLFENVGETRISADFDAELPDSFWMGEDQS
jgi:hypothetical protein